MTSAPPDLANMSVSADFWQTSMNETEAWEQMRESCLHDEAVRLIRKRSEPRSAN